MFFEARDRQSQNNNEENNQPQPQQQIQQIQQPQRPQQVVRGPQTPPVEEWFEEDNYIYSPRKENNSEEEKEEEDEMNRGQIAPTPATTAATLLNNRMSLSGRAAIPRPTIASNFLIQRQRQNSKHVTPLGSVSARTSSPVTDYINAHPIRRSRSDGEERTPSPDLENPVIRPPHRQDSITPTIRQLQTTFGGKTPSSGAGAGAEVLAGGSTIADRTKRRNREKDSEEAPGFPSLANYLEAEAVKKYDEETPRGSDDFNRISDFKSRADIRDSFATYDDYKAKYMEAAKEAKEKLKGKGVRGQKARKTFQVNRPIMSRKYFEQGVRETEDDTKIPYI
jgi:hypothetical protein